MKENTEISFMKVFFFLLLNGQKFTFKFES